MIKRIIVFGFLVVIVIGGISLWRAYREQQAREALRRQQAQQKMEEITVTTIEGWTVADMAEALEKAGFGSAETFMKLQAQFDVSDYSLIEKPSKYDLEGYLFPDTYRFVKPSTPEMIINKMLDNFTTRVESLGARPGPGGYGIPGYADLDTLGADRQPGWSLYDVVTLASIVEKESGGKGAIDDPNLSLQEERRLVAGVFYNRLAIGKALESDATVNYVTGKNDPGVSGEDLVINSPYNTYKFPGLPPGPICNPSLGSIRAVLDPIKSDYYYFLHEQPSGKAAFSKTFDEHVRKKLGQ